MNEQTPHQPKNTDQTESKRKVGFLGKMIRKLDDSMKQKAEEKSKTNCCGGDGKGGKCC